MLYYCISLIIEILIWALIAQAILSWFVGPYRWRTPGAVTSIYRVLSSFTYPLTLPARAILAKVRTGPMDFSLFLTVLFLIAIRAIAFRILM
jgi:uncharacterized protein YggT (Ycf19 family)